MFSIKYEKQIFLLKIQAYAETYAFKTDKNIKYFVGITNCLIYYRHNGNKTVTFNLQLKNTVKTI